MLVIVAETIHVKKEKLSMFSSILESFTSKFISNFSIKFFLKEDIFFKQFLRLEQFD
jgi:hypothetical protein